MRGATFTVTLPVAVAGIAEPPMPPVAASTRPIPLPTGVVPLDGLRVIVTDDDSEGLAIAEAMLANAGADVRTCSSAAAALGIVREWRPDVLVSDIEMPGEDGYSLIRGVRALDVEFGGNTPAISLTAYGRAQDRVRCLAAGFNMHVPKPIDRREFTTIIAGLAGRPEQPQVS